MNGDYSESAYNSANMPQFKISFTSDVYGQSIYVPLSSFLYPGYYGGCYLAVKKVYTPDIILGTMFW